MPKETHSVWIRLRNGLNQEFTVSLSPIEKSEMRERLINDADVQDFSIDYDPPVLSMMDFVEELAYWKDSELD